MLRWFQRLYRRFFSRTPPTPDGLQISTSITLGYRHEAWGLDRIVLDTVANHLPADSGGSRTDVAFLVDGAWRGLGELHDDVADAVRVGDDGPGYSHELLGLLFSTKQSTGANVGQFGEGLKMVAAACARERLPIRYASRDWSAVPFTVPQDIEGHSLERLCFLVGKEPSSIRGSQTVFERPSDDLVRAFRRLPQQALAFRDDIVELYCVRRDRFFGNRYAGRILDLTGDAGVFVKGMRIRSGGDPSILSYDLDTARIAPDRHLADVDEVLRSVRSLLHNCDNPVVHERILTTAVRHPLADRLEYAALEYFTRHGIADIASDESQDRWRRAFVAVFGDRAALASGNHQYDEDARHIGFDVIDLHDRLHRYLRHIGVRDTISLFRDEKQYAWVASAALSRVERERLALIPLLNEWAYRAGEVVDVRVFDEELRAITSIDGTVVRHEPVRESVGVTLARMDGASVIGIRRSLLCADDEVAFCRTYLHELGHHVTGAGDYTREHSSFFEDIAARRFVQSRKDAR